MRKRMIANSPNLAYQGPQADTVINQPTRFSGGSMIGSALNTTTWTIPVGFDVVGFESAAKQNFVLLQSAWDRADVATLGGMMTDVMLKEIQQQLAAREVGPHRTAVISLEARLLGIEENTTDYIASVEFTGIIQDTAGVDPEAFEEVWNMTKSKSNGGWVLAGIQVN
jgi:predicted lipid-binding transport protein (Tim44 family)